MMLSYGTRAVELDYVEGRVGSLAQTIRQPRNDSAWLKRLWQTVAGRPSLDLDDWAVTRARVCAIRRDLEALVSDEQVADLLWDTPPSQSMDAFELADRWGVPAEVAAARIHLYLLRSGEWHARMGPA